MVHTTLLALASSLLLTLTPVHAGDHHARSARAPEAKRSHSLLARQGQAGGTNGGATGNVQNVPNVPNVQNQNAQSPQRSSPFRLEDRYEGQSFFDEWNFFDFPDPTNGLVDYVDRDTAFRDRLAFVRDDGVAFMKVEDKEQLAPGQPRKSVRITTKKKFTGGLFLLDVMAMPYGCGTWPAAWTTGENWPIEGEIDILEGVHTKVNNQYTLHTTPGCNIDTTVGNPTAKFASENTFTGEVVGQLECDSNLNFNAGCGIKDPSKESYGLGLNLAGGGVYATLWNEQGIKIWFFPRALIPSDILDASPNPSSWPAPKAFFSSSSCPTSQFFKNHVFVINTTLCGDLGDATFGQFGCPGSCAEFVANPVNMRTAQWRINYLRVFQPN